MADHLVSGLIEVRITCGNGRCAQPFDQPCAPDERIGWIVCPHCLWAAPCNVSTDLATAYDNDAREAHRRLAATLGLNQTEGRDAAH